MKVTRTPVRSRWHSWWNGRSVRARPLTALTQDLASDETARPHEAKAASSRGGKDRAMHAADVRNAQNCTFEVF